MSPETGHSLMNILSCTFKYVQGFRMNCVLCVQMKLQISGSGDYSLCANEYTRISL